MILKHTQNPAYTAWTDEQQQFQSPDEDTPAIEFTDDTIYKRPKGTRIWAKSSGLHRETGPAIEYPDGTVEYWLHSVQYHTEEAWILHGGKPHKGKEVVLDL